MDKDKKVRKEAPCQNPKCDNGVVSRVYKDGDGKWQTEETVCPVCNGTGQRPN